MSAPTHIYDKDVRAYFADPGAGLLEIIAINAAKAPPLVWKGTSVFLLKNLTFFWGARGSFVWVAPRRFALGSIPSCILSARCA